MYPALHPERLNVPVVWKVASRALTLDRKYVAGDLNSVQ